MWTFRTNGELKRYENPEDALAAWFEQNPEEVARVLAKLMVALEGTISIEALTDYAVGED